MERPPQPRIAGAGCALGADLGHGADVLAWGAALLATIGFVFVAAIGGFWLNWDQLGQFSAIATAEWLDALPLLGRLQGWAELRNFCDSLGLLLEAGVPVLASVAASTWVTPFR